MYGPLALKYLAEQRHEEALIEASRRRLVKRARANRKPRCEWASVNWICAGVLSLLRGGAKLSDTPSLGGSSR